MKHKTEKIPYWKTKSLDQMTESEWEALCDGCGKCCLEKVLDDETEKIYTTAVTCTLLNPHTCVCSNYENRFIYMADCIKLTPKKVYEISWLPKTCSYRLVKEGKDLPLWHPLITKDKLSTIKTGNAANKFCVHPMNMEKDKDIIDYILEDEII